jgi:hypothetical protein
VSDIPVRIVLEVPEQEDVDPRRLRPRRILTETKACAESSKRQVLIHGSFLVVLVEFALLRH